MIHATLSYMFSVISDVDLIILNLLPPLNEKNLPWIDVIHPIVVHFVIAMALGAVVVLWVPLTEEFLIRGYLWKCLAHLTKNKRILVTGVVFGFLHFFQKRPRAYLWELK